ncbi:hypothetical protein AN963_04650 [Brevibacillus choshinensis]|uniref:Uncharacterized protein n=1 Tax=Brevibacillus choshinensis TaxID=54911 RepID=A0ABR5NBZ7_BRECH|nr:hypothetical protein [Brevibacillus choshinensis]KQL49071.1 hypothetical protein AN963_04650 [Brevibacillus choshinensis]
MVTKKEVDSASATQPDVYETARIALVDLIDELQEALDEQDTSFHKRQGYEMIGTYFREPVNTGNLTLIFASVLEDILHKLDLTQQVDNVSMVRDEYSVMKKEE